MLRAWTFFQMADEQIIKDAVTLTGGIDRSLDYGLEKRLLFFELGVELRQVAMRLCKATHLFICCAANSRVRVNDLIMHNQT